MVIRWERCELPLRAISANSPSPCCLAFTFLSAVTPRFSSSALFLSSPHGWNHKLLEKEEHSTCVFSPVRKPRGRINSVTGTKLRWFLVSIPMCVCVCVFTLCANVCMSVGAHANVHEPLQGSINEVGLLPVPRPSQESSTQPHVNDPPARCEWEGRWRGEVYKKKWRMDGEEKCNNWSVSVQHHRRVYKQWGRYSLYRQCATVHPLMWKPVLLRQPRPQWKTGEAVHTAGHMMLVWRVTAF